MKKLTLLEIKEATGGELFNDSNIVIESISTDSRKISKNQLFIPIVGENFDGHDFILQAFSGGAAACLSENDLENVPYIKVKDTKKALGDLAEYYRLLFDIKVVAVTGSVGKTTTKDTIASVLSQKYNTLKTKGNFNNEIGLPLTVFEINEDTEAVVLEMGMNHSGEIHNLSKIAKPDICVITNIGVSHMEYLGSQENIFKAKSEIFDFMKKDGVKILNGEDKFLSRVSNAVFFGKNENFDYFAKDMKINGIKGSEFSLCYKNVSEKINIKIPGRHMVMCCLAAAAVGDVLGLDDKEIKKGLENNSVTGMRLEIVETNYYTILNDVYNSSPDSVKSAIDVLADYDGNKVCILGDMLELGDESEKLHYEIGEYAYEKGINVIVSVGKKAYNIYAGSSKHIVNKEEESERAIYFEEQDLLLRNLDKIVQKGDCVLVKASRGMQFEKTVEKLISR